MKKKNSFPTKNTLNLAIKEKKQIRPEIAIPCIVLIALLAFLFGKFAVADRFAEVSRVQGQLHAMEAQREALKEATADYNDVLAEYSRYSVNWMNDVEKNLVLRSDMIDLVNSKILSDSDSRKIMISGNTISIELLDLSLDDTSKLVSKLNAEESVSSVQVYTATTKDTLGDDQVVVSLVITMKDQEGGVQ